MLKYLFFSILLFFKFLSSDAQVNMLTQHNSNARLGSNINETILNTSNVGDTNFRKLYSYPVDGQIYAQPLIVSGLNIPGKGLRNVIYIVTQHNTLYAYDADSLTTPFWTKSFGTPCPLPDPNFGYRYGAYHDIKIEVGTTSTPVIDLATNTIYACAFTKESGSYYHRLHAIDISTGSPKANSPMQIQATTAGTGAGNAGGVITFNSMQQLQRVALTLSNNVVYLAFAGYADTDPYHGWILGYNATTLQQVSVFNDTPNGTEGGIWQSGQGLSVDGSGSLYVITGNGTFDANTGGSSYGDSFLKLIPSGNTPGSTLTVSDWFTPYNQAALSAADNDLGVDGAILPPNTDVIIGSSKEGVIYVLNKNNLGHYQANNNNQIIQDFSAFLGHLHGSMVYWDGPTGTYLYGWSENDNLKAFKFNLSTNLFTTTPSSISAVTAPGGMPGGILSLSSNGSTAGTGIVWANIPLTGNANTGTVAGILRAYDATDLSKEIWNSQKNAQRDTLGNFAKFNSVTVANGKVYTPTFSNKLIVYGIPPVPIISSLLNFPHHNEENITLYPNPANENSKIKIEGLNSGTDQLFLEIKSMDGKLIWSSSEDVTFLISKFNEVATSIHQGMYVVRIQTSRQSKTIKFIKE